MVKSHDDFPGVEISIAGGVGEMVRGNFAFADLVFYRSFPVNRFTNLTCF